MSFEKISHTETTQTATESAGFYQEFFKIFGKNPDEIASTSMKNTPGKIDASYLARLLLTTDVSTWIHIANMNRPLTPDLKDFTETYENILAYFSNPDYTSFDFVENEETYPELVRYLLSKFSKSDILSHNVRQKTSF